MKTLRNASLFVIGLGLMLFPAEASTNCGQIIWCGGWAIAIACAVTVLHRIDKIENKQK